MAAIGETLRQARLRSGVGLDGVAETTKINSRFLEAIEAGDFDKLPGGVFARMFVKQYADALGLDGASFAEEFQRSSAAANAGLQSKTFNPSSESFRPSVAGLNSFSERFSPDRFSRMLGPLMWLVTAIVICSGVYYGIGHLPKRFKGGFSGGFGAVKVATAAPVAKPEAPVATVPAVPAPAARVPIELTITATEPVWVSATADGKSVFSGLLPAGGNQIIGATSSARLNIGNAGGLEITFNGKKQEPFGPKGQIRTVEFTPAGAQVVSRTLPKPDPLL